MSGRGLGAALFLPLCLMAGARSACSQETGSARWRMAGGWIAVGPNAPFETRLGTRRHQLYLIGLRARRPLLRGGAVELYHTIDIVPLAVSGATPVRYEQASCDSTGPVPLDRTGVASLCGQQVQRRAAVYGAGLVPAGLELRYAPHRGVRVVVGATIGALYFTRPLPDPNAARLNFAVAGDFGVRVGTGGDHAIDVRYRFQHISNGGTAFNPGMNAHMLQVGLGM